MRDEVEQIILGLTKTFKAMQMYGMGHSSFLNFFEPFYDKLSAYLKQHNDFQLKIEKFTMIHENREVYKEEEMDMSIAFRLFKDGIRMVGFQGGLTSDELLLFIDVISRPAREWDVALGLWECNFIHVTFYVIETDEVLDYKIPDVPVQFVDYDEKLRQLLLKEKIDIDAIIVPDLNLSEVDNLKQSISREEKSTLLPVVIDTLNDYLHVERSPEIIDGLIEILATCVNGGDFYNARRICYKLKDYPDVDFISRFENQVMIAGFQNTLNVPEDAQFNECLAFIGFLTQRSAPFLMALLPFVERSDRRNALKHRIAQIVETDPALVAAFLEDRNTDMVVNAIDILGVIKPESLNRQLEPLMYNKSERVRAAIVDALADTEHPDLIARFVDDPAVEVRTRALRALGKHKYPGIYPVLLSRIKRNDFLDLSFSEQREVFNNLTANRDDGLVPLLNKMLFKRKWFGGARYRIMRRLAALALSQIDTEETRAILRTGLQSRNKDVRMACETVLKEKAT